jgi:hypothetical protein
MRKFSLLVVLLLFGFLLVGCGGGSSDDDTPAETTQETSAPTASTEAPRPSGFSFTFTVNVPDTTASDANIYMVGSFNDWTPADEDWKLVKVSDTEYTIEQVIPYDNKLSTTIEFKFVNGDSMDFVEKSATGGEIQNRTFTLMKGYTGSDTFTVAAWGAPEENNDEEDPAATSYDFTINVTVPAETPTDANIYLRGSFVTDWALSEDWKLEKVSDTLYKIEKSIPYGDEESLSFEYKVVLEGDWANVEKNSDDTDVTNREFTMAKETAAKTVDITVGKWAAIPADDTTEE